MSSMAKAGRIFKVDSACTFNVDVEGVALDSGGFASIEMVEYLNSLRGSEADFAFGSTTERRFALFDASTS